MRRVSAVGIRIWSLLFVLVACAWWWVTRTHAGSWWWAAALNAVPPQVLLPWPLWLAWRASKAKKGGWVWLNLLAAAVFTVSTVGFVLPKAGRQVTSGIPLTLMTLNTNFASASPAKIAEVAVREGVQVVVLQETLDRSSVGEAYEAQVKAAFPGWMVVRHDELLTVTRLPVLKSQMVVFPDSPHAVLVTQLRDEGQTVTVVNTHLPTLSLIPSRSDQALGRTWQEGIEHQLAVRRGFQKVVAGLLKQGTGPLIVAGDLNTPPRGGVVNQMRYLKLQDAFALAGTGFGFTHHALFGHSRLDYVWLRGLKAEQAAPLRDLLSDHRALVVRLRLPDDQAK